MIHKSAIEVSDEEREAVFETCWARGGIHVVTSNFGDILLAEPSNMAMYNFWRKKIAARVRDPELLKKLGKNPRPARPTLICTVYLPIYNKYSTNSTHHPSSPRKTTLPHLRQTPRERNKLLRNPLPPQCNAHRPPHLHHRHLNPDRPSPHHRPPL
jgi:hypothetical protein